jgi:hypothetical protein
MPVPQAMISSFERLNEAVERCDRVQESNEAAYRLAKAMRPFLGTLRQGAAKTITEAVRADGRLLIEGTPEAATAAAGPSPVAALATVDRKNIEDADDRRTILYAELLSRPVRTFGSAMKDGTR